MTPVKETWGPRQTARIVGNGEPESTGPRQGVDDRQEFRVRIDDDEAPAITAADRRVDGSDRTRHALDGANERWNLLDRFREAAGVSVAELAERSRVDIADVEAYCEDGSGPSGIGAGALPSDREMDRLCAVLEIARDDAFPWTYNAQRVDRAVDRIDVADQRPVEGPLEGLTAAELAEQVDTGAKLRRLERLQSEAAEVRRQRDILRRGAVADAGHELIRSVKQAVRR